MALIAHSTAPQSRDRTQALIDRLADAARRDMLRTWLRHWWAEIQYDVETCIATVTPDIAYRWHGTERLGDGLDAQSREFARGMYQGMCDAGLMPGGPFDRERWAFGDWGLTMEAIFTSVMPGDMLKGESAPPDPEALYLIQWPMIVVHPFDRASGLMSGEIMYAGAPLHIEPAGRDTIARLLGR